MLAAILRAYPKKFIPAINKPNNHIPTVTASPIAMAISAKKLSLRDIALPDQKRSPDIINRCAEYAEHEAAANDREQHGRFNALDLLLLDVQLGGEMGHGDSP
jgi:hypothetical protein